MTVRDSRHGRIGQRVANTFGPNYVFRPAQLARRVMGELRPAQESRVMLPWGSSITCHAGESVGLGIRRRGVHDLPVCETLLRLTDPGETAVDVGANFGQMTSLLAHAVGARGRVIAFEPHPDVFALLMRNAHEWMAIASSGAIELRQEAVSSEGGMAQLATDVFEINQGSATLEPLKTQRHAKNIHSVPMRRLDKVLEPGMMIGVMKMDVEGHELHALEGAREALAARRIRDIVFEERREPPTPVTALIGQHGYALMRIGQHLRGPTLAPLDDRTTKLGFGDDPSLLATLAPERAVKRLGTRGWAVYGVGPAKRVDRETRPRASPSEAPPPS